MTMRLPYDVDRYESLVRRATFNAEYWRGTIRDQSPGQRTMAYSGAPRFRKQGNFQGLQQLAAGDGTASAVTPAILDAALPMSFEVQCLRTDTNTTGALATLTEFSQTSLGGFTIRLDTGAGFNYLAILLYDAAGAWCRMVRTADNTILPYGIYHVVWVIVPAPYSVSVWINAIPATPVVAGAGIPATTANAILYSGGGPASYGLQHHLFRTYNFALTGSSKDSDVSTLYKAAQTLACG